MNMAMWGGRFAKDANEAVRNFTASVHYDQRLYKHDIAGSIAHAKMLAHTGIIPAADAEAIAKGLREIANQIEAGKFTFDPGLEDVHMNIEAALTTRIGAAGARLHTGRSRNDQIATDERLYLRDETDDLVKGLRTLQTVLVDIGARNITAILPGFTHLQHAQPVLLAHHLLAYVEMFERDIERLVDGRRRINRMPLGAGALAGSTLPLDRDFTARELGFENVLRNSMDAVADRDYLVEFLADLAIIVMHTSRLAEDLILWASQEFTFLEMDDAFSTGSSLMPQKKNPDIAELTRGKTGRVYGSLVALLTTMKGLPLTYNRDLQEDKEGLFDAIDTVRAILTVLAPMLDTAKFNHERMRQAASDPALMATDLAEWLVQQGVPFRDAHHQVGRLVGECARQNIALDQAPLTLFKQCLPLATEACRELFACDRSVAARDMTGGTAPSQVQKQIAFWRKKLDIK